MRRTVPNVIVFFSDQQRWDTTGIHGNLLVRDRDADRPDEAFIQVSETEVGRAIRTSRWKHYVTAPRAADRAHGGRRRRESTRST